MKRISKRLIKGPSDRIVAVSFHRLVGFEFMYLLQVSLDIAYPKLLVA
jgi:hypothetical protein